VSGPAKTAGPVAFLDMDMTPERWEATQAYIREVFGDEDEALRAAATEAAAAGLPPIAINAEVGRLLAILTSMTRGMLAVELGTLGGYSGTWLARALAPGGRLITVEADPRHAEIAARQFERAGLENRVEIRRGRALDVLDDLSSELGAGTVDVAFVDAAKTEYPDYARRLRQLIAPGGLFLADNVLGTGGTWIDDTSHPGMVAVDEMNRLVAGFDEFESVIVPLRQGVLVARKSE
jgi:predicted O-methyltransferase YrrM